MGKFTFSVDGNDMEVEAETPQAAFEKLQAWRASQAPSTPAAPEQPEIDPETGLKIIDPVSGIEKSVGTGAVSGVAGLLSLPSTAAYLVDAGIEKVSGGRAGIPDAAYDWASYDNIKKGIENYVTGKLYEPKTRAEKFAKTITEFATGAGAGGAVAKGARGAAKLVRGAKAAKAAAPAATAAAPAATTPGQGLVNTIRGTIGRSPGGSVLTPGAQSAVAAGKSRAAGEVARQAKLRGAANLTTGAIIPGATSEAAGQLPAFEGTSLEPVARVVGGVAGALAPGAIARVVSPGAVSKSKQAALKRLADKGVTDISPGNLSGSKGWRGVEGSIETVPFGKDVSSRFKHQFTNAALKTAGIPAIDDISKDAVNTAIRAKDAALRIEFENIGRIAEIRLNPTTQSSVRTIRRTMQAFKNNTTKQAADIGIMNNLNSMLNKLSKNKGLTGPQYAQMRRELADAASVTSDTGLQQVARTAIRELDNMVEQTLTSKAGPGAGTAALSEFRRIHKEYRNLRTIDDALAKAGDDAADGLLTPQLLRQPLDKRAHGAKGGTYNDLKDLNDDALQFYRPYNDSGTALRQQVADAATKIGSPITAGGAAGAGTYAATGNPQLAYLAGVIGAATPTVGSHIIGSKPVQAWLRNQKAAKVMQLMDELGIKGRRSLKAAAPGIHAGVRDTPYMEPEE